MYEKYILALVQSSLRRERAKEARETPQMIFCKIVGYSIHYPEECIICEHKCNQYYNLKAYLAKYKKSEET